MASKPRLDLTCFGAPRLALDGKQVEIKRRKSLALLIYLAITQRSYTREALATMFWPDAPTERAYANLRQSLWEINQALGPGWVQAERDTVALDPSKSLRVDVIEFRQRLAEARQAEVDENQCQAMLEEAVQLYQGQFLAGYTLKDAPDFDEWVFFESESLQSKFRELLENLVRLMLESSKAAEAIPYARRRVALDHLDEVAQHQLIEAYAQSGQHNAALRQHQEYVHLLEEELGEEPGPEMQALYEQLQRTGRAETAPVLKPVPGTILKNRYHLEELLGQIALAYQASRLREQEQVTLRQIQMLHAPDGDFTASLGVLLEGLVQALEADFALIRVRHLPEERLSGLNVSCGDFSRLAKGELERIVDQADVAEALITIVRGIQAAPRYILAKGGITSNDVAAKALGVRRAVVAGQIIPGVPVWRLGEDSRFPGLSYIVFPGNVGTETSMTDVVQALRGG